MTTMEHRLTLDDGREFIGKVGRIESTELGLEDDLRFFWGKLTLVMDHGVQDYAPIVASPPRRPSLAVHAHIIGVINAVGVRSWEQLQGKRVMALYDASDSKEHAE